MAKLVLHGDVADVELAVDEEDGQIIAACVRHGATVPFLGVRCLWMAEYDDMRDAVEYAADHADTGRE